MAEKQANARRGPINADAKKRLGNVGMEKGVSKGGIPVVMWDAVPACNAEDCKMEAVCPYTHTGKCSVRLKYLTHVYKSLIGQVDENDAIALFKVGFHLIPLYGHLIQFKMEEYGQRVMYSQDNGKRYVNPIFKEIRETIKVISAVLKDLSGSVEADILRDSITHGDSDYYDSLFQNEGEMVTRKRNKV